ncbi:MAG TPA: CvpA family protein [Thermodesulfobacteriota bacterium]|nr:CvpA family protein [Thermodesulfobacteriota bacterium]
MNWLDITIAAIIALFTLVGFSRGLVSQIFSIAALLGGLVIGFIFYDVLGDVFIRERLVENESVADVGGFIVLAFAAYVIIQTAGWITSRLIGTLHLSWLNRICGGAVGAVMGAVAAFLLSSCLSLFYTQQDPIFKRSALLPYLNEAALLAKDALPEDFEKSFNGARELVREEGLDAAMKIKDSEAVKEILREKDDSKEKND